MELVRRASGQYELALPWLLPHAQSHVDVMNAQHPRCLECRHAPPHKWTREQVEVLPLMAC